MLLLVNSGNNACSQYQGSRGAVLTEVITSRDNAFTFIQTCCLDITYFEELWLAILHDLTSHGGVFDTLTGWMKEKKCVVNMILLRFC